MSDGEYYNNEIVHECELDHPRERVWYAVTTPALLKQWIGLAPGNAGNTSTGPDYRIVEAREPVRVRLAWHAPDTDRPHSTVIIELEPLAEDRTLLRLTHRPVVMRLPAANDDGRTPRACAA